MSSATGCRCFRQHEGDPEGTWVILCGKVFFEKPSDILARSALAPQYFISGDSRTTEITISEAASRVKHEGLRELLLRLSDAKQ